MIEKRLKEIMARREAIDKQLNSDENINIAEIKEELRKLDEEESELRERKELIEAREKAKEIEKCESSNSEIRSLGKVGDILTPNSEERKIETVNHEQRGKLLKEKRSIVLSNQEIPLANYLDNTIKPTFNDISSIADLVAVKSVPGGESFRQPYEKPNNSEGQYTGMGADYSEVHIETSYADINKTKITAYQEEPEEIVKLANSAYDSLIVSGTNKALKKKIVREILVGDGELGHFTGIFHNPTDEKKQIINPSTDLSIETIDADTLDNIIYSYGGDEDVESPSVLILNKKDLKAFAQVRDNMGRKVYDIVNNGNKGSINKVPFVISSVCGSIADTTTAGDTYCMAYGPMENYQVVVFSSVEVARSTDYKFRQGVIAHKGSIFAGGNVVAYNGFIRVKKKAKESDPESKSLKRGK